MDSNFKNHINSLAPISLKEMDAVSLMKRTDTKFIVPMSQLTAILKEVGSVYWVLEINEDRLMTYSSMYFDTLDTKFYHDHHNGRVNRTKIRIRNYVESDLFFLEIKQKNGKGITNKKRIAISGFEPHLSKVSTDFIKKTTDQNFKLEPTLINKFNRVTLVSIENQERVTIDIGLTFTNDGKSKKFEELVVIELKQERFNRQSAIVKSLNHFGFNPYSMSKYCMGMVSLYEDIKYNAFKRKVRYINKIIAA
tara:strand:+ start:34980 stop:35732 length:753 start_codon:yes stop_codon:yes gene_type:complete